jgi:CMP-N,N'-diacetyllegionaminic acid synthase
VIGKKKILALVTARGGSKRLPKKNTRLLNGKPLISWSIEAGLNSKYIDDVYVSTDNEEIARISEEYGAKVPFLRPQSLALDDSKSIDVIIHAIDKLTDNDYDYLFLLQPTSPLRSSKVIDDSIEFFIEKEADSVIGVTKNDHPIEWANKLNKDLLMNNFYDSLKRLSEKTEESYVINGAVYFCNIKRVLQSQSLIFDSKCYGYVMEKKESIDIDYDHDFLLAELILKNK